MVESSIVLQNFRTAKIILIFSITNALFWGIGKSINVYSAPVVGAIFEILWLPTLLGLFILPILAIIFWVKDRFDFKSLNIYSIVIAIITVIITIFFSDQGVK